ncbi:DMT family transporter [Candidatus Gromoviella agglomerans]|uniref:DMT family transporter n=1 Tax=Candidatus Gromoviella agglomerans TaxID=2806609 RepID=UPI001E2F1ED4|nr:DMT family transporter [Candidatus Gromoviella agglomerans]UFX98433.1 DMT family transporter C-terminal domain protein [Candidatus Gromoviella agglomerans]
MVIHFTRAIAYAFGSVMWFISITKLPLSVVMTIGSTSTIWNILASMLFLNEKFTLPKFTAVSIGIFGSIMMIFHKMSFCITINFYLFSPILANICYAMCNVLAKKMKNENENIMTFYMLLFSLPIIGIFIGYDCSKIFHINLISLLILFQAILSVTSYYFTNKAVKFAGLIYLVPFGLVRPLIGYVVGVIFFKENINIVQILGSILIFSSCLIAAKSTE